MPRPGLQVDNIFVFIRQVAPVPACRLFKTPATSWPFDLKSVVRVTCDVGYLCANFSLPRPLCSRVRPDVRDRQTSIRQTDIRQHHRLMPPPIRGEGIIKLSKICSYMLCPWTLNAFSRNYSKTLFNEVFSCLQQQWNGQHEGRPTWLPQDILSDVRLLAPEQLVNWGGGGCCRERGLEFEDGISGGNGRGMRYGDITLLPSSDLLDSEWSHDEHN